MGLEIERKFLVRNNNYRSVATESQLIQQAYLNRDPAATVRVRIAGDNAWLTVKGLNDGPVRHEWEYPIPVSDAVDMIEHCAVGAVLSKTRWQAGRWEIDEYHGKLEGLTVAEIELSSADEQIELPDYIGREVTGDPQYYNSILADALTLPPTV